MKKALLTSLSALLLAGCAENEFLGSEEAQHTINGDKPILFTSQSAPMTRGEVTGKSAAELLGENYVVYGTKGTSYTKVFDHYNINWYENTKGSTETNVADWEYVGQDLHPNNTLPEGAKQFIKYWDFSAPQYDFVAFSYGKANKGRTTTIATGAQTKSIPYPILSQINPSNLGKATTTNAPVYTVTGKIADLVNTYVADLVTVTKDGYNKTVTPRFRQMGAKVRIAIYETVAGYAVKDVKFYYSNDRNDKSVISSSDNTPVPVLYASSAVLPDNTGEGTVKVYFPTLDANNKDYNKAHAVFAGSTESPSNLTSKLEFKGLNYSKTTEGVLNKVDASASYLGTTSNEATYATTSDAAGAYVMVLPYGAGNDLKLHVDYTLVSVDGSGETINVKSATAIVPSTYTNWQPNYAYTYIFKISKDSNGTTGDPNATYPDPAGLYPITFDAIVMDFDDEHVQETITTVATPSITTYSKGGQPTANSEYKTGNNIYVSVDDATVALSATNAKLYTATVEAGALQSIDENSIANALMNGDATTSGVWKVKDAVGKTLTVTSATSVTLTFPTTIAATDAPYGNAVAGKFAMFNPTVAGTYVFEYIVSEPEFYETYTEYNTAKSTNLTADEFAALPNSQKVKAPGKKYYKIIIVK